MRALTGVHMGTELHANGSWWDCEAATEFAHAFDHKKPVYPERFVFRRVND